MDISQLIDTLSHNQFLTGGVGIALMGGVLYKAKAIATWLGTKISRSFTASIEFNSMDSDVFREICRWVWAQPSFSNISTVMHSTERNFEELASEEGMTFHEKCSASYIPRDGLYFGRVGLRPMWVRTWTKEKGQYGGKVYHIEFRIISKNKKFFTDLVEGIESKKRQKDVTKVIVNGDIKYISNREWDSVYIEPSARQNIETVIDNFIKNKEVYKKIGSPYKLNILLEGPPGTGKTSLAMAIAAKYKKTVHYVPANISNGRLTDTFSCAKGDLILIEDIDVTSIAVDRKEKDGEKDKDQVSLSTILNCLDGALFSEGAICIITTNKKEVLDEALVRTNRIDSAIHLGNLNKEYAYEVFSSKVGVDLEAAKLTIDKAFGESTTVSPASLHEIIRNEVLQTR